MKELEYPFDSEYIIKKKKSLKRELLADENAKYIHKKIAILGGETTENIKLMLELFLLNYGIMPEFYESEYNQYYCITKTECFLILNLKNLLRILSMCVLV